jgi:hypothetical protein
VHSISHRHRPRLRSTEDALYVIDLALGPDTGTVALIDRAEPAQGLAIPITGNADRELIDRLDSLVLEAIESEPGCRVVLATRRKAGLTGVAERDVDLWRQLQDRHAASGIPLLDWFVLSGPVVLSVAGLTGTSVDWRAA